MRVCILQTILDPFKGGSHLPLLACARDVQFTILCNKSKVIPEDLPPNVKVITVQGRIGPYYYGFADFCFARLLLQQYPVGHGFWKEFDVLHFNQCMGPALHLLRRTGIPLLMFIHHPVTADRDVAVMETAFPASLLWRLKYTALIHWQKSMCQACHRVVTVSETVRQQLHKDYSCPLEKITVVPNGVATGRFTPDTSHHQHDIVAIGSFIHPRKGFRYLADAYRRLAAAGKRIVDVGRRSEEQSAILRSIQGVDVRGTVSEQELLSLVQQSSVLISTSLYEGFGLSLIEALSCGRPSFAFAGGAVPEVLGDIDRNLCVPLRDTEELVRRVTAFLDLPLEVRHERGMRYREAVTERYPLTTSGAMLSALYRDMCC